MSKRAGQQRERSTVDTGDHYDHYDGDDKVDGDDVPDADGDDQVNLTAVRVITAVLTQGRFAGGQGQEYAQVPSFFVPSFYSSFHPFVCRLSLLISISIFQ